MVYIADRGYTDIKLNRHVDKGANLEEEYKKEGIVLSEERIKYLVEERKIYKTVETINQEDIKEITEDNKEEELEKEITEDNKEEELEKEITEDNKEEELEKEVTEDNKEEELEKEVTEEKTKNNTKANKKNTTKNDEK